MNKIQIAATLLREVAKNTTDAAAFKVVVNKEKTNITLSADEKRVSGLFSGTTFYHTGKVVDICRALGLSFYISTMAEQDANGFPRGRYEVHIY